MPAEIVSIDCPNILLTAPPIQVEILFRNLVDNAIKYGGTPPRVRIIARMRSESSGEVTVSVCDNGAGIPANLRRKVFGRFVRLGNELERSKPGTGLGLYLVRNVTHALGGRINVGDALSQDLSQDQGTGDTPDVSDNSSPPGLGTRFDITLREARIGAEQKHNETAHTESSTLQP